MPVGSLHPTPGSNPQPVDRHNQPAFYLAERFSHRAHTFAHVYTHTAAHAYPGGDA